MPKYEDLGDPTLVLAEEAAEVIKEVMKANRFGLDKPHPGDGTTPRQRLTQEIADFMVLYDILVSRGIVNRGEVDIGMLRKSERLVALFGFSVIEGTIWENAVKRSECLKTIGE